MSQTAQEIVSEVIGGWSFDVDAATGLRWLNRRHKTMVRRARLNRKTATVGTTTADQGHYVIDALDIYSVEVDGVTYNKALRRDERAWRAGRLRWTPSDEGLFVVTADTEGAIEIVLIPTPSESGKAIEAFVALPADDLAGSDVPLVPEDWYDALMEGVAATGYARDQEQTGPADRLEARFDAKCEELRVETARRFRGRGPTQIRLAG